MVITRIGKSRKERGSFAIFIDGTLAFHTSSDVVARYGLHVGLQLDENTAGEIVSAAELDRARRVAVNFLSYRPRSMREIVDKLTRKGFSTDLAARVAQSLHDANLLNDLEFARMFVRDKLRGKPMGRAMVRKKLMEKGIAFQIIERVLKEYITEEEEQRAAAALAEKRLRLGRSRFAGLDSVQRKRRLMEYLLSRGFSTEVALKTVRTVLS